MKTTRKKCKKFKRLLICLYGDADSGKSSTLLELAEILRCKSRVYAEFRKVSNSTDCRVFAKIFRKAVGIGTYGDLISQIEETILMFSRRGAACSQIILTASRDKIIRKTFPSKKVKLNNIAIWNIPKVLLPPRLGPGPKQDIACVTTVGVVLQYLVAAARARAYCDVDFN